MFLFLPIGDEPNPPGIPYVNYGLLAANVVIVCPHFFAHSA